MMARTNPIRVMMDQYGERVGEVAGVHDAILVDTQSNFDRILKWTDPLDLALDRIHINLSGHMLLARAFLQQVGFSWERSQG